MKAEGGSAGGGLAARRLDWRSVLGRSTGGMQSLREMSSLGFSAVPDNHC
jgi:hypothetical protein